MGTKGSLSSLGVLRQRTLGALSRGPLTLPSPTRGEGTLVGRLASLPEMQALGEVVLDGGNLQARAAKADMAVGTEEIE